MWSVGSQAKVHQVSWRHSKAAVHQGSQKEFKLFDQMWLVDAAFIVGNKGNMKLRLDLQRLVILLTLWLLRPVAEATATHGGVSGRIWFH